MRRDVIVLGLVLVVAAGVRIYPPWRAVLAPDRVDFLENDAWYHVRLIENQVRNWPWRVTLDPYAAVGGQFVPIAPFFDTITATAVRIIYGRDASTAEIERLAAFVPPVLGVLAVGWLWALARQVFDWRAALFAAALLAILPGHFLDRTLLGFYDHHALEALLAIATLWALAVALDRPNSLDARSIMAGVALGLYLLGWGSGAFLVGILGVWLLLFVLLASSADDLCRAARVTGTAALVAFIFVIAFQDPRMFRYESQVLGLMALAGIALAVRLTAIRMPFTVATRTTIYGAVAVLLVAATGAIWALSTGVIVQLVTDLARLAPDPRRMGVLEARPLFLYPGSWTWAQPWDFFRTGFFVGLAALVLFTARVWRERRAVDLLMWSFAAAMFVATIGQNRFGYYLVSACALLGGWLAARALDWGGTRSPRREVAVVAIAGVMFAPNLSPSLLAASRGGSLPGYWRDAMVWLRDHTPPPFLTSAHSGDEYYFARYPRDVVPPPDYSVMNWWDHGYWLVQIARRVPVANPTQERAPNAARFYAATDESTALKVLTAERSRYVVSDWELPFRLTPEGAIMGRFQNVVDWAGAEHARYYEVFYRRDGDSWTPVWVFYEPYYRSMAFRLMVLGGAAAVPSNATSVMTVLDRVDEKGTRFAEIISENTYESYDAALDAAKRPIPIGRMVVVGVDPWRAAFPVEALTRLRELHAFRTPDQNPTESPYVRIFDVR